MYPRTHVFCFPPLPQAAVAVGPADVGAAAALAAAGTVSSSFPRPRVPPESSVVAAPVVVAPVVVAAAAAALHWYLTVCSKQMRTISFC